MLGGVLAMEAFGMVLGLLDMELHYIEHNDSRQRGLSKLG